MKKYDRFLLTLAGVFMLSACGSTNNSGMNTADIAVNLPESRAKTVYEVNKDIEAALISGDQASIEALYNPNLLLNPLETVLHRDIATQLMQTPAILAQFSRVTIESLSQLNQQGSIRYIYSDTYQSCCWVSHYEVMGDDKMYDLDLYINKSNHQIVDFHTLYYRHSNNQAVAFLLNQLLKPVSGSAVSFRAFIAAIAEYKTAKIDYLEIIKHYQALPEALRQALWVGELLAKTTAVAEKNPEYQQAILAEISHNIPNMLALEGYYVELEEYRKAISAIESANDRVKSGAAIKAELGALYALNNQTDKALASGLEMLIRDPNNILSLTLLLSITLETNQYQLTNKVLDVIVAKYEVSLSADEIRDFGNAEAYLASGQYQQWLNK